MTLSSISLLDGVVVKQFDSFCRYAYILAYWLDSAFGYFLKIERKKEGKREQINKYGIFNELG